MASLLIHRGVWIASKLRSYRFELQAIKNADAVEAIGA
jgi:hypothetical protein